MDQDYIRSRYGGEGQEQPSQTPSQAPPPPPPPAGTPSSEPAVAGGFVEGLESHLPRFEFGGEGGAPWYEARWAIIVFAIAIGPVIGVFVWWVITRYDLEFRVKLIAAGLSVLLTLIVALLL
jgi:hypothetical protein